MLNGEDIVCLALRAWDSPWKNNQQVMSRLAQANRVFYFGPPRPLREALGSLWDRPRSALVRTPADGLYVYRGPRLWAYTRRSRAYNEISARLRLTHARRLARRLGFTRPLLWVYNPMLAGAVGTFHEKLVIYHVIDNYHEYFPAAQARLRTMIARNHVRMLQSANVVFTVSASLREECLRHNPHCYLAPNGVDVERFQASAGASDSPADLRAIPKPIIGYVGVIQSTFDSELLRKLADERPGWSIVVVGPDEHSGQAAALAALAARPNVYYLGPKDRAQVPAYIKAVDVAILPYRVNAATAHIDSLKLYEYLACGGPIVTTDIPSVHRFEHVVRIARSADEFVAATDAALQEDGSRRAERMALAREHSWDRRVSAMRAILADHLQRTGSAEQAPDRVEAMGV
jgi:glycosyltransferase involved in cell wall biosynthesis